MRAHIYMGQQSDNLESTTLFEIYIKRIFSNHVLLYRALSSHVGLCVSTCCLRTSLGPHRVVNVLGFESLSMDRVVLVTTWWITLLTIESPVTNLRIHAPCDEALPVNHIYHKTSLNHMVPYGWWFQLPYLLRHHTIQRTFTTLMWFWSVITGSMLRNTAKCRFWGEVKLCGSLSVVSL